MDERLYRGLTISRYHKALLQGEMTTEALVTFYLKQMDLSDMAQALVFHSVPKALDAAKKMDRLLSSKGLIGPLHGVPILVSDSINVAGVEATAGHRCLMGNVPEQDAYAIKRLIEAGAIVLAKTKVKPFGLWDECYHATSKALALDFGLLGIAVDRISALRSGAAESALIGFRPSSGLVSRSGLIPELQTQDTIGVLSRNIEDSVIALEVMKGYDSQDSLSAKAYKSNTFDLRDALLYDGLMGKRIGVLNCFFGTDSVHERVNDAVKDAVETMVSKGAHSVPLNEMFDSGVILLDVSVHLHEFKDLFNASLGRLQKSFPHPTLDAIYEEHAYTENEKSHIEQLLALSIDSEAYRLRSMKRRALKQRLWKVFADHRLDALVFPHWQVLSERQAGTYADKNGILAAVTGFPSVCIPVEKGISLELIGVPFSENTLIEIAYAFEKKHINTE